MFAFCFTYSEVSCVYALFSVFLKVGKGNDIRICIA